MKAIRVHAYGDPEVMGLETVPEPEPYPGQVLVRVYAVGVNPVETYIRSGIYTQAAPLPYTPGTDAAGVVEAVGSGVTTVELGDRVYTSHSLSGTYAEKTLCQESHVHPLPEGVSFEQGAGVTVPYAAAYRALFQRARAAAGEVVLVHGASGGAGVAAVQLGCRLWPDRHRHRGHRGRPGPRHGPGSPFRPGPPRSRPLQPSLGPHRGARRGYYPGDAGQGKPGR